MDNPVSYPQLSITIELCRILNLILQNSRFIDIIGEDKQIEYNENKDVLKLSGYKGYLLECVFLFIKKIEGANNEKELWIVFKLKRQNAIK